MKNLASFSLLHKRVTSLKEQLNLEHLGHSFDRLALKVILHLNDDDIDESLTDGSYDCGIDAIHINDKSIHILNCKYAYDIDQTVKNFPGIEIDKIISTMNLILQSNLTHEAVNDALWDKYIEIKHLFENGNANSINIHIVSNKQKPVSSERLKLENSLARYRIVSFKYYDLEDLVSLILSEKEEIINSDLLLLDDQHFEKSDGSLKTVIGVVTAEDYIKMLLDSTYPNKLNESAFNDNVRVYKPKHSVNKAIIESALSDSNYHFFYLNNGVTILCEDCNYTPHVRNQKITLKNLQVINGGQTTHSIFEAYKKDKDKVKNIDLLVRICVAKKDTPLAELISESTNNQIPIGSRDLKANDFIQKKLEDEFLSLGYYYERKNNQFSDIDVDITKVLNNELLAQLYLSYELDMPSEAKNNKNLIFNEFYEKIFNEEAISAEILLKIYNLYLPLSEMKKDIQHKKRKKELINEKESFTSRAIFHIINGVKIIFRNENKCIDNPTDCDYALKKSILYISEIVDIEMNKRKELYTHDKFFKEITTNKIISSFIINKYAKHNCA